MTKRLIVGYSVLILLLVEYPFGPFETLHGKNAEEKVLILLLVEYPFGRKTARVLSYEFNSLNPSFSGISFRTLLKVG